MAEAMSLDPHLEIRHLEMAYGEKVIMEDLTFEIRRGEIFVIMGGSGCGKSTLLRHLVGLKPTTRGEILVNGRDLVRAPAAEREALTRRFGVSFQAGGLWGNLTLAENIALPLERFTRLSPMAIRDLVRLKLAWVGLAGFEDYYPSEISGGMAKRAALARALSLDPEVLFFDEPSAGLDPVSSRRLDELILQVRDGLGATVVVVTHELASIKTIADRAVFLNARHRKLSAIGTLAELGSSGDPDVRAFLARDASVAAGSDAAKVVAGAEVGKV